MNLLAREVESSIRPYTIFGGGCEEEDKWGGQEPQRGRKKSNRYRFESCIPRSEAECERPLNVTIDPRAGLARGTAAARGSTQKLFLARAIPRRIQAILVAVVDAIVVVVLVLVAFLGEETTRFLSCK